MAMHCVREMISEMSRHSHCDVVKTGAHNVDIVYKPPTEPWDDTNPLPSLPHPAIYVEDFNSHLPDWGYDTPNNDSERHGRLIGNRMCPIDWHKYE